MENIYPMNTKEIEEQIALLKAKAIDKVDYYFNEFVLEDVYDIGGIDYLIGEDDWYNYYVDLCRDINSIINELIDLQINSKTKKNLLHQCISLKVIIDNKILSNPNYNRDGANFDIFDFERIKINIDKKENPYIELSGDKSQTEIIIQKLWKELTIGRFINCSFEEFANHFKPNSFDISLIYWHGTEAQMAKLFELLFKEDIIAKRHEINKYVVITEHFINKKNKSFNNRQLSQTTSKKFIKKNYIEIEKIIEELKKVSTS